jgi:hypothetical protein
MSKQIEISDETYQGIKTMLASRGDAMPVDQYVDRTVNRYLFFETVREIKERNKDVPPEVLQREIDEAVAAVRADRRQGLESN